MHLSTLSSVAAFGILVFSPSVMAEQKPGTCYQNGPGIYNKEAVSNGIPGLCQSLSGHYVRDQQRKSHTSILKSFCWMDG